MSILLNEVQNVSPKFDHNLLEEIIKNKFNLNKAKIVDVYVNTDFKKGDSYLSTLYRFTIEANGIVDDEKNIRKVSLRIIAKGLPNNLAKRKTFRSVDFFSNEVIFYNKVWPALKKFQETKNILVFDNVPLCYHALADGVNDFIAMEDLNYEGFRGITRSTDVDLIQVKIILKLFARFHGTSLAFKFQFPDKFVEVATSLQETYFAEKFRNWYVPYQKRDLISIARDAVKRQLSEPYLKKFDEITSGDFFGDVSKVCEKKGRFAVVTHGDAWLPNFLIKYDSNGAPLKVVMIDFQLSRYSSLAQDILFFLYVCLTQDLRKQYWDDLINVYYEEIANTVSKLGSPNIITLKDVQNELRENALFGLGMGLEALIVSLLDDDEIADIDNVQGDDALPLEEVWIIQPFESTEKHKKIADFIKDIIDRGYLPLNE